jgi:ribosomal protein S27E
MKELFDAIDKHGSFVFWICPKGCNGIVVWNENKVKATCKKCGTKSTDRHNEPMEQTA